MKWFRLYNEILDDPKVLKMEERLRWRYICCICLANINQNRGFLPEDSDITLKLRLKPSQWEKTKQELINRGFLDLLPQGLAVHSFDHRQYESDSAKERMKRYRESMKQRNSNVTVTPPEPDTEPEPDSDTDTDIKTIPTPSIVENKNLVSGLVNSILKKSSGNRNNGSDKTIFVGLLIKIGIPKGTALNYTERYPLDYLARKIVQFEYIKTTDHELTNPIGYLRTIIEHDKYPPPEEFFEYAKTRAQKLIDSNIHAMQILGSYL